MGINHQLLRFLPTDRNLGDVLTLGRQDVMISDRKLRNLGLPHGEMYADKLLMAMGAESVTALDYSGFEAARFIHDLNRPIDFWTAGAGLYNTIIDGGTLEHVFNLPQALANVMELLRLNGRLIIDTPCNNWFGHGFYQFSPELFYGTLNRSNGFTIERMVIHRLGSNKWHEVLNPLETGHRTELMTIWGWPMMLKVLARRVEPITPFSNGWPQQSDFATRWRKAGDKVTPSFNSRPWWSPIKTALAFLGMSLRNKKCFKPYANHHQPRR